MDARDSRGRSAFRYPPGTAVGPGLLPCSPPLVAPSILEQPGSRRPSRPLQDQSLYFSIRSGRRPFRLETRHLRRRRRQGRARPAWIARRCHGVGQADGGRPFPRPPSSPRASGPESHTGSAPPSSMQAQAEVGRRHLAPPAWTRTTPSGRPGNRQARNTAKPSAGDSARHSSAPSAHRRQAEPARVQVREPGDRQWLPGHQIEPPPAEPLPAGPEEPADGLRSFGFRVRCASNPARPTRRSPKRADPLAHDGHGKTAGRIESATRRRP